MEENLKEVADMVTTVKMPVDGTIEVSFEDVPNVEVPEPKGKLNWGAIGLTAAILGVLGGVAYKIKKRHDKRKAEEDKWFAPEDSDYDYVEEFIEDEFEEVEPEPVKKTTKKRTSKKKEESEETTE